ncbi:MAG: hypothetical protein DWQ02_20835 [Bacteroidetes bacterium]|nr:MAG: hypothetical protein DWQ02_20835 [Bacteroidota bacterium]
MKDLLSQNNEVLILYSRSKKNNSGQHIKRTSTSILDSFFRTHFNKSDVRIIKDQRGKPQLNVPGIHLSISHSGEVTICALSRMEIGVDVELERPVSDKCFDLINKLYARYFKVNNLEDWVKFESALKLKNLRLDSVAKKEKIAHNVFENIEFQEIKLFDNYKSFVCAEHKIETIRYQYIEQ